MKDIIYPIIIAILILFSFKQCEDKKDIENYYDGLIEYKEDSIQTFRDKYGKEIVTTKALRGDLKHLNSIYRDTTEQLKKQLKRYKKTDAAGSVEIVTKVDTMYIPYKDTINKTFNYRKEYFSIKGRILKDNIRIDSLNIPTNLTFVIGRYKDNSYRIEAISSNPYIKIKNIDGGVFKPSPIKNKRFSIGPTIAYGISLNKEPELMPFIGFGITYQLIQF